MNYYNVFNHLSSDLLTAYYNVLYHITFSTLYFLTLPQHNHIITTIVYVMNYNIDENTPQMTPSYQTNPTTTSTTTIINTSDDTTTSSSSSSSSLSPNSNNELTELQKKYPLAYPYIDDEIAIRHELRPLPGKYTICIVSDFFYPRLGGVELHQYQLSQALLRLGHRVIIVTGSHSYTLKKDETIPEINGRQGIRHMAGGLKVYYCPQMSFHNQVAIPTLLSFTHTFRQICIRERIQIVHGHQTTSPLAHEALFIAGSLGLRTVFTDHSLFSLNSLASIHVNKLMEFSLRNASHVIAVSHTLRENLVLRANLSPHDVSAIPNALDTSQFKPNPKNAPNVHEKIVIVVVSRLVYRKGIDLIIDVIPPICERFPNVEFLIGGCGPKEHKLRKMIEKYSLQDRVIMCGEVDHSQVQQVLTSGHIFLNCSLTESFCIAILEAISCGLYIVATKVGGVPEIVPSNMISFAEPETASLIAAICEAIPKASQVNPQKLHQQVSNMYSWHRIANKTEVVYDHIMSTKPKTLIEKCEHFIMQSYFSGILWTCVICLGYIAVCISAFFVPNSMVDLVPYPGLDKKKHIDDDDDEEGEEDEDNGVENRKKNNLPSSKKLKVTN